MKTKKLIISWLAAASMIVSGTSVSALAAPDTGAPAPGPYLSTMPYSTPENGSNVRSGDIIFLNVYPAERFATIEYSLADPSGGNVSWIKYASHPITAPNINGRYEFWARLTASGYTKGDIQHFVFTVRIPTMRVVLKVTMNKLPYTVNGVPMMFDVAPYLDSKEWRSMIPSRFIAEAFGAAVRYDEPNGPGSGVQTISLSGKPTFMLCENVPLPNGMGTPVMVKDRFFVPIRFVSETLGASVDWDEATQTNTIIYYQ